MTPSAEEPLTIVSDRVTVTIEDGVADVRLNRPDKLNALDGGMFAGARRDRRGAHADRSVRAVVLSGEGRGFCAGLDLAAMTALGDAAGERRLAMRRPTCTGWARSATGCRDDHQPRPAGGLDVDRVPVPVIAAMHGHAFGGGLQIALGADIRFVTPDAKLSVMEIRWGLIPDMTGTDAAPPGRPGRRQGADVHRPHGLRRGGASTRPRHPRCRRPAADAIALAPEIAGRNPDAVRGAKALLNASGAGPLAEAFLAESRAACGELIGSPNQIEAVTA